VPPGLEPPSRSGVFDPRHSGAIEACLGLIYQNSASKPWIALGISMAAFPETGGLVWQSIRMRPLAVELCPSRQ